MYTIYMDTSDIVSILKQQKIYIDLDTYNAYTKDEDGITQIIARNLPVKNLSNKYLVTKIHEKVYHIFQEKATGLHYIKPAVFGDKQSEKNVHEQFESSTESFLGKSTYPILQELLQDGLIFYCKAEKYRQSGELDGALYNYLLSTNNLRTIKKYLQMPEEYDKLYQDVLQEVQSNTDASCALDHLQASIDAALKKNVRWIVPLQEKQRARAQSQYVNNNDDEEVPCVDVRTTNLKECLTFADIAGQENAKKRIRDGILNPLLFPRLFNKKSKGILFYGPPGTGKTLLAKAFVNELQLTGLQNGKNINILLYSPTGASLKGKYVGDTEKNITKYFRCASQQACDCEEKMKRGTPSHPADPTARAISVIFIDEIEAIAKDRSKDETGIMTSSVNTLLQMMDGVESLPNVIVMGATNYPWILDSAILRRFDQQIYVELPSKNDIETLLQLEMASYIRGSLRMPTQTPTDPNSQRSLQETVNTVCLGSSQSKNKNGKTCSDQTCKHGFCCGQDGNICLSKCTSAVISPTDIYAYYNKKYFQHFTPSHLTEISTLMAQQNFSGGDVRNACFQVFREMGHSALDQKHWSIRYIADPKSLHTGKIVPLKDSLTGENFPFLVSDKIGNMIDFSMLQKKTAKTQDVKRDILVLKQVQVPKKSMNFKQMDPFLPLDVLQNIRKEQERFVQSVFQHNSSHTFHINLENELRNLGVMRDFARFNELATGRNPFKISHKWDVEHINIALLIDDFWSQDPVDKKWLEEQIASVSLQKHQKLFRKQVLAWVQKKPKSTFKDISVLKYICFPIINFFIQNVMKKGPSERAHTMYVTTSTLNGRLIDTLFTDSRIGNCRDSGVMCEKCNKVQLDLFPRGKGLTHMVDGEVKWVPQEQKNHKLQSRVFIPANFEDTRDQYGQYTSPSFDGPCAYKHPSATHEDYLSNTRTKTGEFITWLPGSLCVSTETSWWHNFKPTKEKGDYTDLCGKCYFEWYKETIINPTQGFVYIVKHKHRFKKITAKSDLNIPTMPYAPLSLSNTKKSYFSWLTNSQKAPAMQHMDKYLNSEQLQYHRVKAEICRFIEQMQLNSRNTLYLDLQKFYELCYTSIEDIQKNIASKKDILLHTLIHIPLQIPRHIVDMNVSPSVYCKCNFQLSKQISVWKKIILSSAVSAGVVGAIVSYTKTTIPSSTLVTIGSYFTPLNTGIAATVAAGLYTIPKLYKKYSKTSQEKVNDFLRVENAEEQAKNKTLLTNDEVKKAHALEKEKAQKVLDKMFAESITHLVCINDTLPYQNCLDNFTIQVVSLTQNKKLRQFRHCLVENYLYNSENNKSAQCDLGLQLAKFLRVHCKKERTPFCHFKHSNSLSPYELEKDSMVYIDGQLHKILESTDQYSKTVSVNQFARQSPTVNQIQSVHIFEVQTDDRVVCDKTHFVITPGTISKEALEQCINILRKTSLILRYTLKQAPHTRFSHHVHSIKKIGKTFVVQVQNFVLPFEMKDILLLNIEVVKDHSLELRTLEKAVINRIPRFPHRQFTIIDYIDKFSDMKDLAVDVFSVIGLGNLPVSTINATVNVYSLLATQLECSAISPSIQDFHYGDKVKIGFNQNQNILFSRVRVGDSYYHVLQKTLKKVRQSDLILFLQDPDKYLKNITSISSLKFTQLVIPFYSKQIITQSSSLNDVLQGMEKYSQLLSVQFPDQTVVIRRLLHSYVLQPFVSIRLIEAQKDRVKIAFLEECVCLNMSIYKEENLSTSNMNIHLSHYFESFTELAYAPVEIENELHTPYTHSAEAEELTTSFDPSITIEQLQSTAENSPFKSCPLVDRFVNFNFQSQYFINTMIKSSTSYIRPTTSESKLKVFKKYRDGEELTEEDKS